MAIPETYAGTTLRPSHADITVRRLLAYAAGIGETDARYFDDMRNGGIVGVPAFCVSLEWPVVSNAESGGREGVGLEEARRGVHYIQDSTFHRPIRPNDRLLTCGRIVAVRPSRAGTVAVTKLETVDAKSEAPVTTSWSTGIFRDVPLEGPARELESPPAPPCDLGHPLPSDAPNIEIPTVRTLPHTYTECADIWNPIHTERSVALAAGLPDIILHGTATWALAAGELVRAHANGDGTRLRRFSGRFTGMVIPGTTITVRHAPDQETPGVLRYEVVAADGSHAISDGFAVLTDPDSPS
jgi:acyl dehydratase